MISIKHIISVIFLVLIFSLTNAQNERFKIEESGFTPAGRSLKDGTVTIEQNMALRKIVRKHISVNSNKSQGWRVQIYFGSGQKALNKAKRVKENFLYKYGDTYNAYIIYDAPYFKVRTGDFRTKAEALKFKQEISKHFNSTWIVDDKVNYTE